MHSVNRILGMAVAVLVAVGSEAAASWQTHGVRVMVGNGGAAVPDGAGGAFIAVSRGALNRPAWRNCLYGSVHWGHIDSRGEVLSPDSGVVLFCNADGDYSSLSKLEADGLGNVFVTIHTNVFGAGSASYLGSFDGEGRMRWPFADIPQWPVSVADGRGGVYIHGFTDWESTPRDLVHYDAARGVLWSFPMGYPGALCGDGFGGVIALTSVVDSLRVRRIDSSGRLRWGIREPPARARGPLVGDGRGGAWVMIDANSHERPYGVRVAHLDSSGAVKEPWAPDGLRVFEVDTTSFPKPVADGTGGLLLLRYGGGQELRAVRAVNDGFLPGWNDGRGRRVCTTAVVNRNGLEADIAPDGQGGAYVLWQDTRGADGGTDIYAAHITAEGELDPGWNAEGEPICTAERDQKYPELVSDAGSVIATWTDERGLATNQGVAIYAQRLPTERNTPATLSRTAAIVDAHGTRLRWHSTNHALAGIVLRRRAGQDWVALGPARNEGRGDLSFEDRSVVPSERFQYRLEDVRGAVLDEVWVDVPGRFLELALVPNPTATGVVARFSLPTAGTARMTVYDVAGRTRAERVAFYPSAGIHTEVVVSPGVLEPGVYIVRFVAAGQDIVRRVVIAE